MDVKGITWVGNVYQKFEAMCLEVEEIMYQDTVKYVENQVQTVGTTVKKFYSDVVQDLLPPSSMDPVKVANSDFPVPQYSDARIYKRSKLGIKRDHVRVDVEQLTEDSKVIADMNKDVGRALSFQAVRDVNNLFPPSSGDCVKGTCPEWCSGKYSDRSIYSESNLGVKENPKIDKLPPIETSGEIRPINDMSRASSFCELLNENHESSHDQTAITSTPAAEEVTRCDSLAESCTGIENASEHIHDDSMGRPSSDMIVFISSIGDKGTEMRLSSFDGFSKESNDICKNDGNNGAGSLVGSSLDTEVEYNKLSDKEVFVSHPGRSDDWNLDAMESSTVSEQGVETREQCVKKKLEETCVLVSGDELHYVPHKEGKRRPYKKKIREAFSSRMKSARKQEYEQLAVLHGDNGKSNQELLESSMSTLSMGVKKKSATHDLCESEWELL